MTSSSGKTSTVTTVQNTDPWSGAQPYITKGLEAAQTNILDKPSEYYPNSTVVPFAPQTEQALSMYENRATSGSPTLQAANDTINSTLSGDYLNSNPAFQGAVDAATRPMVQNFQDTVLPAIQGGFSSRGRYGSGLQAYQQRKAGEDLTRQVGDVASKMAYQNYGDERGRMIQGAAMAPTLAQSDYMDAQQLERVGNVREAQAGAELQDQINRFNFEQQAPKDAASQFLALVNGGSYGGTTTGQQPIYRNPTAENLGMAATGLGIYGSLFGNNGMFAG